MSSEEAESQPTTKETGEQPKKEPGRLRRIIRGLTCVPVLTFLILFAAECGLRMGNPIEALGYRSVDVWNLGTRLELVKKECPEVVMCGSSLLLVLNQDKNGTHFYSGNYPPYFQALLRKASGAAINVVNLCTGMQSVPEAYLIAEAITENKRCYPKVIFYGIGLREYIDYVYIHEWQGECFNSVAAWVTPTDRVLNSLCPLMRPGNGVELLRCHGSFLYRNRLDLQNMLAAWVKDGLEYLPLAKSFTRIGPNHQYEPQRIGYLHEQWVPRKMEKFGEEVHRHNPEFLHKFYKSWWTTLFQRVESNRNMLDGCVAIQDWYLKQLIKLCREKSVILVLVDMPISKEIRDLAPPGLYDEFRKKLAEGTGGEDDYILIDYLGDPEFGDEMFKDGIHLNYTGAKKLAERLTGDLKEKYPFVLRAIERQHGALEESQRTK